jgi:hypothetical protein
METYFKKDYNTSWVINSLEQKKDDVYYYDTLKLFHMFNLTLINPNNNEARCFFVSLYLKRDEDCNGPYFDTKLTLSKIKNAYVDNYFDQAEAENDVLLSALINEIGSLDWEKDTQNIMFETTISFKAQGLVNWSERGKTKTYHIVGMSLEG